MSEQGHHTRSSLQSAESRTLELQAESQMESIFYSPKILWHRDRLLTYLEQYRRLMAEDRLADLPGTIPVTMEIDLTNLCSHRCPLCAGRRARESRGEQLFPVAGDGERMPASRAEDYILQMAAAGVRGLIFTGGGEPTTHGELAPLAALAHRLGMRVGLITHGGLLHKHDIRVLLSVCSWIRVSVDAGTPSDFLSVHGRTESEWNRVWRNIAMLAFERDNLEGYDGRTPTLGIAFLAGPANIQGLENLAKLAQESHVDYLQVRPFHSCLTFDVSSYVSAAKRLFDTTQFNVVTSLQKYCHVHDGDIAPRTYSYCHISQFASVICANNPSLRS